MAVYGSSKSVSKAKSLKVEGNKYFEQDLDTAVRHYTQALFFAPYPSGIIDQTLLELIGSCDPFLKDYLQHDPSLTRVKGVEGPVLAHCYGNRSAALYELGKYEECLVDIDRALTSRYPNTTIFKLYKRQALCLAHLGRSDEAISVIEQCKRRVICSSIKEKDLLQKNIQIIIKEIKQIKPSNIKRESRSEEEKDYCSFSMIVQMSPDKGRSLVIKKDMSFGDCVLCETPYVAMLKSEHQYTHCSYCLKISSNLIPCPLCAYAGYCSMSCMQIAWRSYHWLECKNIDYWNKLDSIVILAIRMLLISPRQDVQTLIKKCQTSSLDSVITELTSEDCTYISDIYQTALKLESHNGKYVDENQKFVFEEICKKCTEIFLKELIMNYYELDSSLLSCITNLLLYHMCQARINSCTVMVHGMTEARVDVTNELVSTMNVQWLGFGVYLTGSLFNHSCDPNVILRFNGIILSACVLKSCVYKGKELCRSYGPEVGKEKRTERQKLLKNGFFFICNCRACYNPDKTLIYREHAGDGLACLKCQGLLPLPETGKISQCLDCGCSTDISHHLKVKHQAKLSYQKADEVLSLPLFEKCYKEQSRVLYKFNDDLSDTCDAISSLYYNVQADYKAAVPYCKQRCDGIEVVCGSHSYELTRELSKLIQALVGSDDKAGAVEIAHKILPLLKFYYGDNYKNIIDLSFLLKDDF